MVKEYDKGFAPRNEKEFILETVEKILEYYKLERFKIYNIPFLLTRLKYITVGKEKDKYYKFIKNIKIEFE